MPSKETLPSYNCHPVQDCNEDMPVLEIISLQRVKRALKAEWRIRREHSIRRSLLELKSKAERKHTEAEETPRPASLFPSALYSGHMLTEAIIAIL